MVSVKIGDIFESQAQTLVNTVNCVGVMGKGVALEFRKRFPNMYDDYVKRCNQKKVRLGRPYLYRRVTMPWVLNFPTKAHWRSVARLADITEGLDYLARHYRQWGITSLAVPPLGCGQGQLDWAVVGKALYRGLSKLDIPVELYAPYGTPDEQLKESFLEPSPAAQKNAASNGFKINPAWVALVEVVARIQSERYHWPIGRTTFQKIAYFATESGLPTGLRFNRGSYGPFTHDLKALATRLVNNGLIEEDQLGPMFAIKPGPTYADAAANFEKELKNWDPIIDRLVDLFLRMRTKDAELAATVHFAARALEKRTGRRPSETDVLEEVKRWKQRRRPSLREADVAQTIRDLNVLGWLDAGASDDLPVPEDALSNA